MRERAAEYFSGPLGPKREREGERGREREERITGALLRPCSTRTRREREREKESARERAAEYFSCPLGPKREGEREREGETKNLSTFQTFKGQERERE